MDARDQQWSLLPCARLRAAVVDASAIRHGNYERSFEKPLPSGVRLNLPLSPHLEELFGFEDCRLIERTRIVGAFRNRYAEPVARR